MVFLWPLLFSYIFLLNFPEERKCVDIIVISNRERKAAVTVSWQNCQSYICTKYLSLSQLLTVVAVNFKMLLYSTQNAVTSSAAKTFNSKNLQFIQHFWLNLCVFLVVLLSTKCLLKHLHLLFYYGQYGVFYRYFHVKSK